MMNTRARASLAQREHRPRQARGIIRQALHSLRQHYERIGQEEIYGASSEVATLQAMLRDIRQEIPPSPLEKLKRQLNKALKEERYEEAAQIRDSIARCRGHSQNKEASP
jgi:excinuclease UvrABC helicase subunit UvrB